MTFRTGGSLLASIVARGNVVRDSRPRDRVGQWSSARGAHVDKSLTFLRHENGLDVYLNAVTGTEVFVGRTGKAVR